MRGFYTVKLRRGDGFTVKENAEQVDGKTFCFDYGWIIDDIEHYKGETAMIPVSEDYPRSAPAWIASGDLIKREKTEILPKNEKEREIINDIVGNMRKDFGLTGNSCSDVLEAEYLE